MVAFSGRIRFPLRHEQTFSSFGQFDQTQLLPAAVVDDVPAAIWRSSPSLWRASNLDLLEIGAKL